VLWDQNRTAMDASMVQVVQSIVRLAQLVFFGVECDETTIRERHQLDQFGVGANQIADDGLFRRDHIDRRNVDLAAVALDVVSAPVSRHR